MDGKAESFLKTQILKILSKKQRRVCEKTLRRYRSACLAFADFANKEFGVRKIQSARVKHIRAFFKELETKGLSKRSIYDYARAIRFLLSYVPGRNPAYGSRWDEMKIFLGDYVSTAKRGRPARINRGFNAV